MLKSIQSSQTQAPSDSLPPENKPSPRNWSLWAWAALAVFLIANLPLMVCMPLTADPIIYDLQAQTALEGGVLYRDIVEPNLPGIVWVHMAVRTVLGWSSYALRSFDLLIFAGIVWFSIRIARSAASDADFRTRTPTLALLLCWFYFSLSEWTHCQRDIWMMLPALAALDLRIRQLRRFSTSETGWKPMLFWGGLEGVLWGTAFWIKPFVALPATAALIVSAFWMRSVRKSVINFSGVLAGGLFCGIAGSAWLIQTGAWPHFWEMALNWNPQYLEVGRERWTWARYSSMLKRFLPWSLVHLAVVPLAVRNLLSIRRAERDNFAHLALCLFSAVYLGWLIQTHTLQHLFDYVHVSAVFLGLGLLAAAWPKQPSSSPLAYAALASLIFLALISSPATEPRRLAWWGRCLTEGSTPEVRCSLQHVPLPDWEELQPVLDFLEVRNLKDGNLTAYHGHLIHLYPELGLKPSTRYVYLDANTRIFKNRTAMIRRALEDSPQQFVVSSLLENGMKLRDIGRFPADQPPELPAEFPADELDYFPYNQELVFRSGQYVVHRVTKPVRPLNTNFLPLERSASVDSDKLKDDASAGRSRRSQKIAREPRKTDRSDR